MIKQALFLVFLLCFEVNASSMLELKQCKSSEELAMFIHRMATQEIRAEELLEGLHSSERIKIASSGIALPVKEIYGTIVEERFGDELGSNFHEHGNTYKVREICSFLDAEGQLWRFHIGIFNERQYEIMEQFLRNEINKTEK